MNRKYAVSAWILTALIVTAVILLNLLAASLTSKYDLKYDITDEKQYEISDTTKEVMKNLDTEVTALVMGTEDEVLGEIKEYLQKYAAMSNYFKVQYVDVYENQSVLNKYIARGDSLAAGDIILESGERYKIISASSIWNQTMSFEPDKANFTFELESKLTNGIVVTTGLMNETKTYFLEGHGEQSLPMMEEMLSMLDFPYDSLNTTVSQIPEDAGLLVLSVPASDISADEVNMIENYFERGGNMFVVFAPGMEKHDNLNSVLEAWGIVPNYDLVYEKDPEKAGGNGSSMLTDTVAHEITDTIRMHEYPLISDNTSSFKVLQSNVKTAETTVFMETSERAIGKINPESMLTEYEEGDITGKLALGVAAEVYNPEKSRLVVLGSITTLQGAYLNSGNSELLSGLVSWLTNNNNTLKIAPKIVSETIVEVPVSDLTVMYYLLVWIIPGLILLAGIIIWIRRRYL